MSHYPDVISKVVADGEKVVLYRGVSSQLYELIGKLALESHI